MSEEKKITKSEATTESDSPKRGESLFFYPELGKTFIAKDREEADNMAKESKKSVTDKERE